jgi:hypothetical protein
MKQSLFNIESEYLQLVHALEDGEVTPELEEALAINEAQLEQKAVGYAHVIRDSDATVTAIKEEIARLHALQKSEQRKADALKAAISNAMQLYGINEIKTPIVKLSFRRSEAVVGDPEAYLPDEFVRVIPEQRKADLTAIKAAIKEGREVDGYCIETRSNLQIK